MDNQHKDKIFKEYEEQCEEIMRQMLLVLYRAQRKVDDVAYRKIMEQLQQNTK